ncbi:hypothetical protein B0I35DRAFT_199855 [Stachybotrys elegans]|uniref:Uncharacterized protein n=1 Tax=Stachybotrys elegans TaxID=80388 RepID=A0A8K0WSG3_9HYPO|nr:hypothetical protein B0I35DRAFT_199855 [Stachybotrys elegans]
MPLESSPLLPWVLLVWTRQAGSGLANFPAFALLLIRACKPLTHLITVARERRDRQCYASSNLLRLMSPAALGLLDLGSQVGLDNRSSPTTATEKSQTSPFICACRLAENQLCKVLGGFYQD